MHKIYITAILTIILSYIIRYRLSSIDRMLAFSFVVMSATFLYLFVAYVYRHKNKACDIIFVATCLVLCVVPLLKINVAEIDSTENRRLAIFPKIMNENNVNYNFNKEFELWLNDRFYPREKYLNIYNKIRFGINRRADGDDAFQGQENWLFYKGENSVTNFQNTNLFTDTELQQIKDNLIRKEKWLHKRGISYYVFIAPDKNRVYGEYYPKNILKTGNEGRAEQLYAFLRKNCKVKVVYPLEELMTAKKDGLIYYKTDTHWNEYGALIGYKVLIKTIQENYPDIHGMSLCDFNVEKKPRPSGDLLTMLKLSEDKYKDVLYLTPTPKESYVFSHMDKGRDGVTTKNPQKKHKLFMLRDSFCTAMVPYLANTFASIEFIWAYGLNLHQDEIVKNKPDIVIEEIVERNIFTLLENKPPLKEEN